MKAKSKFLSINLGDFFKRENYSPSALVNDRWDEITTSNSNEKRNIVTTGAYKNIGLPLAEELNSIVEELELFNTSLPNLKK